MKKYHIDILLCLYLLSCSAFVSAQQSPDSIFARYFRNAQSFADTYPREKVHLHFDNTSYYLGDTLWFKAYVTMAEGNLPTVISKPLYVELLDQLGNVKERQIVELNKGVGCGQIIFNSSYLSGYYEVRAYTRWMLAFEEKDCFSRTFPIYQKLQGGDDPEKIIGTYYMDESMKQRPHAKEKTVSLRFFPEGGSLVRGLSSIVGFEVESKDEGMVAVEGTLLAKDGSVLTRFRTLHHGMGYFAHTPGDEPATAEIEYKGRTYRFDLPGALPHGYVMQVSNNNNFLNVQVRRSSTSLNDTLALFVSQQGRVITWGKADFAGLQAVHTKIPTQKLSGVVQVSLITTSGAILCERLCYVLPPEQLGIKVSLVDSLKIYRPFTPIRYRVSLKDNLGNPVHTRLSVSVRDALRSDCLQYDNNIYTDLLLTSDLKGYIHQPGYYFVDRSPQRLRELDALLLVRGWRKYDLGQIMGAQAFTPVHLPETKLVLHGQIRSSIRKKAKGDMLVSILAKRDTLSIAGYTMSDSLGYFHVPVENFDGKMDALIQTQKKGSKHNKETIISLYRNFSPPLRQYGHEELFPVFADVDSLRMQAFLSDSLFEDSIMKQNDFYLLDEVKVKAKKRRRNSPQRFEQSISAYYDVPLLLDEMRDRGIIVDNIATFLAKVNPRIFLRTFEIEQRVGEKIHATSARYGSNCILYLINGKLATIQERRLFLEDDLDAIRSITLCEGKGALNRIDLQESKVSLTDYQTLNEEYLEVDWRYEKKDTLRAKNVWETERDKVYKRYGDSADRISSSCICYISTVEDWKEDKKYGGSWGIRRTQIQGYSKPLEFYSPAYPNREPVVREDDHRRTLYWNPNLETDEQGEAIVNFYNGGNTAFPIISIEALSDDGRVCSSSF